MDRHRYQGKIKRLHPRRWPEEVHMGIAGTIAIVIIFAGLVAFARLGPDGPPNVHGVKGSLEGKR